MVVLLIEVSSVPGSVWTALSGRLCPLFYRSTGIATVEIPPHPPAPSPTRGRGGARTLSPPLPHKGRERGPGGEGRQVPAITPAPRTPPHAPAAVRGRGSDNPAPAPATPSAEAGPRWAAA